MAEEIVLDEDEEAALEAVWDRRDAAPKGKPHAGPRLPDVDPPGEDDLASRTPW